MLRRTFLIAAPTALLLGTTPGFAGAAGASYADPFNAMQINDRRGIQNVLWMADLYHGEVDGRWGPATARAIEASVGKIIDKSHGEERPDVSTSAARAAYLHDLAYYVYDFWLTGEER